MSFIIADKTLEVDYLDIDRAMCAECEKQLKWDTNHRADCCGFRYLYWTSTVGCCRAPIQAKATVQPKSIAPGRGEASGE